MSFVNAGRNVPYVDIILNINYLLKNREFYPASGRRYLRGLSVWSQGELSVLPGRGDRQAQAETGRG